MPARFTLVGPKAGFTGKIRHFEFKDGVHVNASGDKGALANIATLLATYGAYPDEQLEAKRAEYAAAAELAKAEKASGKPQPQANVAAQRQARYDALVDDKDKDKDKDKTPDGKPAGSEDGKKDEGAGGENKDPLGEGGENKDPLGEGGENKDPLGEGGEGGKKEPTIEEVVRALDPKNDEHWTSRGLPSMEAIEKVLGKAVSRADVEAAVPNYNRAAARAAS